MITLNPNELNSSYVSNGINNVSNIKCYTIILNNNSENLNSYDISSVISNSYIFCTIKSNTSKFSS